MCATRVVRACNVAVRVLGGCRGCVKEGFKGFETKWRHVRRAHDICFGTANTLHHCSHALMASTDYPTLLCRLCRNFSTVASSISSTPCWRAELLGPGDVSLLCGSESEDDEVSFHIPIAAIAA